MAGIFTVKTDTELDEINPDAQGELTVLNTWLREDGLQPLNAAPTDGCFSGFGIVGDDGSYAEYALASLPYHAAEVEFHLTRKAQCGFDKQTQVETCKTVMGDGPEGMLYHPDANPLAFVGIESAADLASLRANPAAIKDRLQVYRSCESARDLLLAHITSSQTIVDTKPWSGTFIKGLLTIKGFETSLDKHREK